MNAEIEKQRFILDLMNRFTIYSNFVLINLWAESFKDSKELKTSLVKEFERDIYGNKYALDASRKDDSSTSDEYKKLYGFSPQEHSKIFEDAMALSLKEIKKSLAIT